ncbi:MAG: hypothetical protein DI535_18210 [Citrobacter freundii]|nr:MAG: hypothetical protein DI535_18210 [Citrobacter freundii]
MAQHKFAYHKEASAFLKEFYDNKETENGYIAYGFLYNLARQAKKIAASLSLTGMDYENAIIASWFSFAGQDSDTFHSVEAGQSLLLRFFERAAYPEMDRAIITGAIEMVFNNRFPVGKVQRVVSDAVNSRLAWPEMLENISWMQQVSAEKKKDEHDELFYLNYYHDLFLRRRYYTSYAIEQFTAQKENNFLLLEKRLRKVQEGKNLTMTNEINGISLRETEDIIKLAFRNYNHLVSVADSKAALLIRVNSIIISVVLGLVLSQVRKNEFLFIPSLFILTVSLITIGISILASRPQRNVYIEDKTSTSYQKFFFGSFDLIDSRFAKANWEGYYSQLKDLFTRSKQDVYLEVYKELFNVRKVLSKKFSYLAIAYWVFITGLLISVIAFVISMLRAGV